MQITALESIGLLEENGAKNDAQKGLVKVSERRCYQDRLRLAYIPKQKKP